MILRIRYVDKLYSNVNVEDVVHLIYRGTDEANRLFRKCHLALAGAYQREASRGKTAQALKTC